MQVSQSQVRNGGEKPLKLKIIRLGKHEKIVIQPVAPAGFQEPTATLGGFDRRPDLDVVEQLMQQFGARNIGPGMVFRGGGRGFDLNQFPSGVSVSIQRNNDGPAQITVKQGDTTWQIEGDNEESLKQLPADVRPFVERMLDGGSAFPDFGGGAGTWRHQRRAGKTVAAPDWAASGEVLSDQTVSENVRRTNWSCKKEWSNWKNASTNCKESYPTKSPWSLASSSCSPVPRPAGFAARRNCPQAASIRSPLR